MFYKISNSFKNKLKFCTLLQVHGNTDFATIFQMILGWILRISKAVKLANEIIVVKCAGYF